MRQYVFKLLGILFVSQLLFGCSRFGQVKNKSKGYPLTFIDSVWIDYAHAMEKKDLNYLLQNSFDSVQCAECQLLPNNKNEYYMSEFVFKNHLNKLMHIPSLSDKEFETLWSKDNSSFNVNYQIKDRNAPEGGYNLIFIFTKYMGKWKFKGMIVT
jgi:hypothetical protein